VQLQLKTALQAAVASLAVVAVLVVVAVVVMGLDRVVQDSLETGWLIH
jgi:hypothetical protein